VLQGHGGPRHHGHAHSDTHHGLRTIHDSCGVPSSGSRRTWQTVATGRHEVDAFQKHLRDADGILMEAAPVTIP
jgi:hypothetical protein